MSEAALKSKLLEMDLYKLLDCEETCTPEQLKKAYRKSALAHHPDKNLGNKEAAEREFIQLGKAFEILSDKSARAAYDAVRKAKREKALRDSQMDERRRLMKEKLESNEKAARDRSDQLSEKSKKNREEEVLRNEIERLRKEGSRLLEEEMNFINEQIRLEKMHQNKINKQSGTEKVCA
jgi:DnaJ family protein C protein 17